MNIPNVLTGHNLLMMGEIPNLSVSSSFVERKKMAVVILCSLYSGHMSLGNELLQVTYI